MQQKTIYDEMKSNQKNKVAKDFVQETYQKDKELFNRARELCISLGLYGLWKGVDLAMTHTILALKKEQNLTTENIMNEMIPISISQRDD